LKSLIFEMWIMTFRYVIHVFDLPRATLLVNISEFTLFFIFFSHFSTLSKHYQHILAFQFAVDEINKNPDLLPNITLGFQLLNNFHLNSLAVENSLIWLSGRVLCSICIYIYVCVCMYALCMCAFCLYIVYVCMYICIHIYIYINLNIFLSSSFYITYGPFDVLLTEKIQYPYIYQMGSRESTLHLAFIKLMLHFGWTWVGLIISDNERGENFFSDLKEEMGRNALCVAFKERVSPTIVYDEYHYLVSRIIASSANVIFIYGDTDLLHQLVFAFVYYVLYGKMLVATTSWDFSLDSSIESLTHFHGIILFSHSQLEIPGFTDFIRSQKISVNPDDIFLKAFLESALKCRFSDKSHIEMLQSICPESVSLTDVHNVKFDTIIMECSFNVYNAVYLVAHALHQMLQSEAQETSERERNPDLSWKVTFLFHSWCASLVSTVNEASCGDGTRTETYDILNFEFFRGQIETLVKVGEVTSHGQAFSMNVEYIEWPEDFLQTPTSTCSLSCGPGFKKTVHEGQPICCFECTPCPEGQISNQTEQCLQCPEDQYPSSERHRCLPKTVTFLAYEEPLGMTLACAALCFSLLTALVLGVFVKHRDTPIVKANNRSLSYTLLGSLTLCFLCPLLFIGRPNTATLAVASILAKTITVVLAFKATKPGSKLRRWMGSTASYSLILICTLIQMCLCGIWLGTYPPFLEMDAHAEPSFIVIQCNEGSILIFYCVLGYMALLALGSFTLAFLARNLPDTFNEAKFLTSSMLVFCSVWISFLPMYQSTKGKAMVAVEVFSILASSAGILTCIFAPKCYVILLRPDRNTLDILKNKSSR
uniref:G-protein coupled receptors family 3 profile domain-containing protein n=1 Tax=Vombatus ursinus TaxID=29139 RepID=A0A4X2JXY6_VOMUR